jgi:two-component system, cell cycle sensor histidine kinase and response regulator CckA
MATSRYPADLERLVAERTRELEQANAAAERALRESEARFRALIENSLEITAILDEATVVGYVSPSVERVLGYEPSELIGATALDFIHADDVSAIAALFAAATQDSELMRTGEFRVRHRDGRWLVMEAVGLNLLDDPAVRGMVITLRDVTQRRVLESRLVQAERLEAIGQLAGGIAHDFNNVLLVIRGYSSVLRSTLDDPQQLSDVDEIAKAAERATELTRQLLAFGRRQVMQPTLLGVGDVLTGLESLLRRSLREDIEFELEVAAGVSPVLADASQMEQVVLNLVVNARDAIAGTGAVRVSVAETAVDHVDDAISPALAPGRYVTIAVADSGSGIDAAALPHIFEPFFTTKEDGVGTGLGLSTVYGIVGQSGGGIEVLTSEAGTTFVVYLPVAAEIEETSVWDGAAFPSLPMGSETVLLVEDEAAVRELVRRVLEGAGYKVLVAARPSEVQPLLDADEQVDLMLTDVVMPEMSGYDLAELVRAQRPGIRLLFMSGYAPRVSEEQLAQGELLKKPFAPEELAWSVRGALDEPERGAA